MQVTERVWLYIFNANTKKIPDHIYDKTLIHFIDSLWCYFWSFWSDLWKKYIDFSSQVNAKWWTQLLASEYSLVWPMHAFVTAGMINACDFDDTSMPWGHPWATINGTAISICLEMDIKLVDLIHSINCGYDVINCIKRWTEPSWDRYNKVHWIGTSQVFGSFGTAACLYRYSQEKIMAGLWLAWAFSPIPHACKYWWNTQTIISIKDNIAIAAQNWLQAALLSQAWFTWSDSILDGDDWFWIMTSSDQNNLDTESILLWNYFSIEDASIKPYPCCRWIHGILDVVNKIITTESILLDAIESIQVETMPALVRIFNNTKPSWTIEWQFSIQHNIAMLLLWIKYNLWNFEQTRIDFLEKLNIVREKITLKWREDYQEEYLSGWKDASNIPAKVTFFLKDWSHYDAETKYSLWSQKNPIPLEQIRDKFIINCSNAKIDGRKLFDNILALGPNDSISSVLTNLM